MNHAVIPLPARASVGLFGAIFIALALPARAGTIFVNATDGDDSWSGLCESWDGSECGPKRTIRAGMDAAIDGDEVVLARGTYRGEGNRDLDFAGKAITVRSLSPGDPETVAATVLDCEGSASDRHRAFSINSNGSETVTLAGFTVVNGYAPLFSDYPPYGALPHGGAIAALNASLMLENMHFENNAALSGGAVYGESSSLILDRCVFRANKGVSFRTDGNLYFFPLGGAAHVDTGNVLVAGCDFVQNQAMIGGAFFSEAASGTISDSRFEGNWVEGNYRDGGAIATFHSDELTILRSRFLANESRSSGGRGGAAFVSSGEVAFEDCLFAKNRAPSSGGAICIRRDTQAALQRCTLDANDAERGSSLHCEGPNVEVQITSSILRAARRNVFRASGADIAMDYSNVQGGWAGTGNIDEDPLFAAPESFDYRLSIGSPCIDAGDSALGEQPGLLDLDRLRRPWPERVDMGALEAGSFSYGDLDCSSGIDFSDIDGFVMALVDPDAYVIQFPECKVTNADVNMNGSVDFEDIDGFVGLLTR